MKLPIRYIALLVVLSMTGIIVYQAYWLTNLYHTMHSDMERSITEAIRLSDYNEMMLRVQQIRTDSATEHGEISISTGVDSKGERYVRSTTIVDNVQMKAGKESLQRGMQSFDVNVTRKDSIKRIGRDTLHYNITRVELGGSEQDEAKQDNTKKSNSMFLLMDGIDQSLEKQQSLSALTHYFQRGMHEGLDIIAEPDIEVFEQFFTNNLREAGISLPFRIELLQIGTDVRGDSTHAYTDTLGIRSTPGYRPSKKAKSYHYDIDLQSHRIYRILTEPSMLTTYVIDDMRGILATSFLILVVLGVSFGYLIRILLKQKTLDEMKSDFTNNITHELKTPIAVAYAANDALLNFNQAADKEQRNKYLSICQEQLGRLSALVEQILSMSMERRKSFRLHTETLLLQELLPPLIEQQKLKAEKPVHIRLSIEPHTLSIHADRTHFINIISNLIDNAIKYSREEADIRITCLPMEGETEKRAEIHIQDHGIGISAECRKHLFEKFYRVPTGNLHNVKGYGLGLFYVKTMVEKHGGSVEVKSEPGRGSEFVIKM